MTHYTQRLFLVSLLCLLSLSAAQAQAVRYTLQVEALDSLTPALELVQDLRASGVDAYYLRSEVPGKGLYYRVRVGNFADTRSAHHRGEQLCRAHLIHKYYVTTYEGGTYQIVTPQIVTPQTHYYYPPARVAPRSMPVTEVVVEKEVRVYEETPVVVAGSAPSYHHHHPAPPKKEVVIVQPVRPRQVVLPRGGVITGVGDVPIRVPFENDDLGGSCFFMANGSVMTAATSMGVFTARDEVYGAIIPFAGVESHFKMRAGIRQSWTPPPGVKAADLMRMDVNRAGYREFQAAADPLRTFEINAGRIVFEGLHPGEYMLRARTHNNKCLFLPMSVRAE
jgi:hypothetical protein